MFWAGISDFKTRRVKNTYTYIILVLAAVKLFIFEMDWMILLFGGLVVFIPFIIVAMKSNGVGGADIKLTSALGLYLGFGEIVAVVLLSYLLMLLFAIAYRAVKKQKLVNIPYICFLTVALYGVFILLLI